MVLQSLGVSVISVVVVVAAEDVDKVGVEGVVEVSNDVVDITMVVVVRVEVAVGSIVVDDVAGSWVLVEVASIEVVGVATVVVVIAVDAILRRVIIRLLDHNNLKLSIVYLKIMTRISQKWKTKYRTWYAFNIANINYACIIFIPLAQ